MKQALRQQTQAITDFFSSAAARAATCQSDAALSFSHHPDTMPLFVPEEQ
ncbi:MAG: hypothetical protein HQM06_05280 [Magnetococcales bacterium]|nr:hypothetical protein [Magnetococcales bacterium]